MRYVATKVAEVISTFSMSEPVAWISVVSFQTVVVRIFNFSGLVHRPTLPSSIVRAVGGLLHTGPRVGYKKPSCLKGSRSESPKNCRCQSVSITAENDFVLATSTFSQVPVPVPAVQVPVQVPVLGMQVQVQVPVPENCT